MFRTLCYEEYEVLSYTNTHMHSRTHARTHSHTHKQTFIDLKIDHTQYATVFTQFEVEALQ